ncbi:MAG: hypothetical protein PHH11_07510 [Methylomonas sp.]|nr:hypothetical protein [Methylomonas sp.]
MNINPLSSATNMITSAQQKATNAAQAIAQPPALQQAQEVKGPGDLKSTDYVQPLVSLKESEFEVKSGVKVIQAEKEMLDAVGRIFDEKA